MKTKEVIVLPYSAAWREAFEKIKAPIADALLGLTERIEHVGSTSVPGLWAKPIIDIDVVLKDAGQLPQAVRRLAVIGYRHQGDLGIAGREAFAYEQKSDFMRHHLYVCLQDAGELARHLTLRDHLRTHPEAAAEYSRIKRDGAALYPNDIDAYIAYKSAFIISVYRLYGLESVG